VYLGCASPQTKVFLDSDTISIVMNTSAGVLSIFHSISCVRGRDNIALEERDISMVLLELILKDCWYGRDKDKVFLVS
jgi:hypothetical protein